MVEDEFGATSIGSDASPKFKLKAVGDAAVYEFLMTREVAAGLHSQLGSALSEAHRNEQLAAEPSVGNAVDFEGSVDMRASPKV